MIIQGIDVNGQAKPLLLDASGNVLVSSAPPTTTGGKFHVDANGNLYALVDPPTTTGGKIYVDANGYLAVSNFPVEYFRDTNYATVYATGACNNSEANIYTVTAGKYFYLISVHFDCNNATASNNYIQLKLYNTVPALYFSWYTSFKAGQANSYSVPFSAPLRIAGGWKFAVFSPAASMYGSATLVGYEK